MTNTNPPTVPTPKSRRLELPARHDLSEDRLRTDLVASGEAMNASTALTFVQAEHGELSLTDMVVSLREHGEAVNRGDLQAVERMLNAQAVALNAIFGELARRAATEMDGNLRKAETYLRLALKAQSQSRATLETLSAIKNPPLVYARQANINNGGQQQVNNGGARSPQAARPPEDAGETASHPNRLLGTTDAERVDAGAKGAAGRTHQGLASVGALDRTEDRGW